MCALIMNIALFYSRKNVSPLGFERLKILGFGTIISGFRSGSLAQKPFSLRHVLILGVMQNNKYSLFGCELHHH